MNDDDQQAENDATEERDLNLLKSHAAQLAEHFETVHIFCTRHMEAEMGGTVGVQWGEGNWYARYGFVKDWIVRKEEETRVSARPQD